MKERISILCPTRKRPKNLIRFMESILATRISREIEVLIYVDEDDVDTANAFETLPASDDLDTFIVAGPRLALFDAYNLLSRASRGGIVHLAADDLVYRTGGWDEAVRGSFLGVADRTALVYGRDGNQDERLATHPFLSRRWIDALGYAVPTQFPGVGGDVWLHDLARRIGRSVYLPSVFIEHLHWSFGKAEKDATYRDVDGRSGGHMDVLAASLPERVRDAYKLMALKGTQ